MLRLSLLFVLFLPLFAGAQQVKEAPKPDYRKPGAALPPFRLQNEKGAFITNNNLAPNKPVVIMIFSPECDHCVHFLDSIRTIAPAFHKYQTILVTEKRHDEEFKKWRKEKGIDIGSLFQYSGWDISNLIYFIYTYKMLPQINIYNSKQKLVHSFASSFPLDSLKMYIK